MRVRSNGRSRMRLRQALRLWFAELGKVTLLAATAPGHFEERIEGLPPRRAVQHRRTRTPIVTTVRSTRFLP